MFVIPPLYCPSEVLASPGECREFTYYTGSSYGEGARTGSSYNGEVACVGSSLGSWIMDEDHHFISLIKLRAEVTLVRGGNNLPV